jgi:hypothetical protein
LTRWGNSQPPISPPRARSVTQGAVGQDRLRKLYVPLGGRHFWSRGAYELAYASQRETKFDRALRRARKLRLRLGGDPADDEYPDKPPRMRWATYNRLLDKLRAADGVACRRCGGRVAARGAWEQSSGANPRMDWRAG